MLAVDTYETHCLNNQDIIMLWCNGVIRNTVSGMKSAHCTQAVSIIRQPLLETKRLQNNVGPYLSKYNN
jgi:hypothetical protein